MNKLIRWGKVGAVCMGVALSTAAQAQDIRINEVMPSNGVTLADQDGDFPDWFELFNPAARPVDVGGFGLSDDSADPWKWTIPDLVLGPGEFQVVFASDKDTAGYGGVWDAVVTKGDLWSYRPGSVELPVSWTDPGFIDSTWPTGPSGIGYGDGDDATVINATLSLYARIRFNLDDPAAVERAIFHIDYDDGFVAYLNGTEIARSNLGQAGVRPSHDQPADTFIEPRGVQGLPPAQFVIDDIAALVRQGENVLAVQVHNSSLGSSDLTCIPWLTLGLAAASGNPRPPADELPEVFTRELHTNFQLSAQGEALYVTDPAGQVADSIRFASVPADVSVGRRPDGAGGWFFFDLPTPGATNDTQAYQEIAEPPVFSQVGGRYSAPLTVSLSSASGHRIYYTTDGSTPTEASAMYGGPLYVGGTTVVRARTAGTGVLPSEVVTHTYVLHEDTALPIVAIAADPEALWNEDTGIYAFPPEDQAACPDFPHFCANFWADREIQAHLEIFDSDGPAALNAGAGVTIVGGWSRAFPQKSLGLFARGRYGNPAFNYSLFPARPYPSYQSFLLRNSGNDWDGAMLRDGFVQELVTGADIDRMEYRPSVLYLNGRYWGIHNIREKINKHYAAALGGVDADEVDLIGLDTDQTAGDPEIVAGDAEHYEQMMAFVTLADMRTTEALERLGAMMDLDSFIDYQITEIFAGNTDWPGNNVKLWRPRTPDGRWRWILFDLDFGFGRWNPGDFVHNTLAFAAAPNGPEWPNPPWSTLLFRRLLDNPNFRSAFANRYADFLNFYFDTDTMLGVLDSVQNVIAGEMPDHVARWGRTYPGWLGAVNNVRYYLRNRSAVADAHVQSFFGLSERAPVTFVSTEGGFIMVNRLRIDDLPWRGSYYPTIPLPVSAVPYPGYRFARWTGSVESTDRTIVVDPLGPMALQANFEAAVPQEFTIHINEIQYHAPADMDTDDWVELMNSGDEPIDLSAWTLSDGGGNEYRIPDGTLVGPGDFVVLVRDVAAFTVVHPDVGTMAGGWTFGLSNGGESVYLRDEAGFLVDSLVYDDVSPWPLEADGWGATLELIDPGGDNSLASNWRASTIRGGTPGAVNSVTVGTEDVNPVPNDYRLGAPFPNPFAGSTTIAYAVPAAGRISIRVFDTLGRRVATLMDRQANAGYHTLVWDGAGLPSGVYLVRLTGPGGEVRTIPAVRVR